MNILIPNSDSTSAMELHISGRYIVNKNKKIKNNNNLMKIINKNPNTHKSWFKISWLHYVVNMHNIRNIRIVIIITKCNIIHKTSVE